MENEDVIYISYRNDEDKKKLWRVSTATKIAEFVVQPDNVRPTLRSELTKKEVKENEKIRKTDRELIKTPYVKYQEYYTSCVKKSNVLDIKYITEYLIPLGYCEFQREGHQLKFSSYDDDPAGTIMKTKTCETCGNSYIINIDETNCVHCR